MGGDSEYEPKDSRNVTGTGSTEDGRWTNTDGLPPDANGNQPRPKSREFEDEMICPPEEEGKPPRPKTEPK